MRATRILGVDRDGAFARYVAVPETVIWQNDRAKLPPEIATLQEPFGNAVFATGEQDLSAHSVAVPRLQAGRTIHVAIARAAGASLVAASDRSAFRLGLADRMGAGATLARRFRGRRSGVVPGAERGLRLRRRLRDVRLGAGDPRLVRDRPQRWPRGPVGIPARPVEIDVASR